MNLVFSKLVKDSLLLGGEPAPVFVEGKPYLPADSLLIEAQPDGSAKLTLVWQGKKLAEFTAEPGASMQINGVHCKVPISLDPA